MKINLKTIMIVFMFLIIEIVSYILNYNLLFMTTFSLAICFMLFYAKKIENNFAIVFFIMMYIFFLMSSEFVQEVFHVVNLRQVTDAANNHSNLVLLLGIIFLLVGYQFQFNKKVDGDDKLNIQKQDTIRRISKTFFFVFYPIYILPAIEKMIFVSKNSYLDYYINYASRLPFFIKIFEPVAPIAFAIFLATSPSKKECKLPFVLYLLYNFIILLSGKRYYAISAIIFVVTYCLIRNNDKKSDEVWISKKVLFSLIATVPFVCVGLFLFSNIRLNISSNDSLGFGEMLLSFFNRVGESNKVIKYGYMFKDQMPHNNLYSIGGIIDYLKYNGFTKLFTDSTITRGQNIQYALLGNNYGTTLTYIALPSYFIKGNGLGSCYLAELYQDFGYFGVIIGSIIYGMIIRNIFNISNKSISSKAIAFYAYVALLRTPRDSFTCFLEEILNFKFFFFFLLIILLSNYEYKRKINNKVIENE